MLCKNVPPLYQDIRGEWESGIVEAYLNGELEEENEMVTNQAGRLPTVLLPVNILHTFR